jgi:hypothetical protein
LRSAALRSLISFGERSLADVLRQHQQISVEVLDKDLPLTGFAVAGCPPDFARAEVERPILRSQLRQNGANVAEVDLKHRALPKGMLHRSRLEAAMPLAEHDLLTLGMLQIDEFFRVARVRDFEADDVRPEAEADMQIGDVQLRHDVGPAGFWRRVPIDAHITISIRRGGEEIGDGAVEGSGDFHSLFLGACEPIRRPGC